MFTSPQANTNFSSTFVFRGVTALKMVNKKIKFFPSLIKYNNHLFQNGLYVHTTTSQGI